LGFLRRLRGNETPGGAGKPATPYAEIDDEEINADERRHELEVLRDEQERLDELALRQLRYAKYAWQPPAQGGERRADDRDDGH
jgi:hypothetical protein